MTSKELSIQDYSIGESVNTPFGIGIIWKITDNSIHVKHNYYVIGVE